MSNERQTTIFCEVERPLLAQSTSSMDIAECLLYTESRRSGISNDRYKAAQSGRSDINYYWWLTVELREGDFSRVPCLSANDSEILDHYNLNWKIIMRSHLVDIIEIPVYPIITLC